MASTDQGPQIKAPESFDQPTHIPFAQTTRIIWGDETSGKAPTVAKGLGEGK